MSRNSVELETIGLSIAVEALDDIANHSTLQILPPDPVPFEAEIRFQTPEHLQLFLVRLLDFVDESGSAALTGVKGSCLDVLAAACGTKNFDVEGSVAPLEHAVKDFQDWLSEPTPVLLWLPTLEVNARLTVPRRDLVFIAGNQSKHNLSRLTGVAQRFSRILKDHDYDVQPELVPLALDELRTHLHEDYFVYYGTWLTEHLTTLRWGIHSYLLPTFKRLYKPPLNGGYAYTYDIPDSITSPVAREWFWRLMNLVRRGPYLPLIRTADYLKAPVLRPETEG
jgi:hypothetical protein